MNNGAGFELLTLSPFWFLFICALAAGLLTWVLYRKHFSENKWTGWVLKVLRFLALFLVFCLLLSPTIRIRIQKEVKPALLIFTDRSLSVSDSNAVQFCKTFPQKTEILKANYDLRFYQFGATVVPEGDSAFQPERTSISAVFPYAGEVSANLPVAAMVIISDGIHNQGPDPLFARLGKPVPVYTFGLGDTAVHPDVWVSSLEANPTVFIGNEFTLDASFRLAGIRENQLTAELWEDGKKLSSARVQVSGLEFARTEFVVKADKPGMHRYEIKIPLLQGESNPYNNSRVFWVEVTDTRRKIAIFSHSANPDVAAVVRAIVENARYEVKKYEPGEWPPLSQFDIAICHGFPASEAETGWLRKLRDNGKPFWVIFSSQTRTELFRGSEFGFEPGISGAGLNTVMPIPVSNFTAFISNEYLPEMVRNWPPLQSPYGRYRTGAGFATFFKQGIGAVSTEMPLWGFTSLNGSRQSWLFGEGIWKWRLKEFEKNGNQEIFDGMVSQTIQYLGAAADSKKFRVFPARSELQPGEKAMVHAEYLNAAGEPDNRADVELQVTGPGQFSRNLKMARSGTAYRTDLGDLPPGDYMLNALRVGGEKANSRFGVAAGMLEFQNRVADHGLLRRISAAHEGIFYNTRQLDSFIRKMTDASASKKILTSTFKITELIHWKWFFAIIVILFSAEWFLRKWEGGY